MTPPREGGDVQKFNSGGVFGGPVQIAISFDEPIMRRCPDCNGWITYSLAEHPTVWTNRHPLEHIVTLDDKRIHHCRDGVQLEVDG